MSLEQTSNILSLKTEKKRSFKTKIDPVIPTDIVEIWRLVEKSLQAPDNSYPDVTEDQPELIRSHLFQYLQRPLFSGLIARHNRRPVGTILGEVQIRPFGRPKQFAFVYCFWVEPQFRKQGVGKILWDQYTSRLKKAGVFQWEALSSDKLLENLGEKTIPVKKLVSIIGGKL